MEEEGLPLTVAMPDYVAMPLAVAVAVPVAVAIDGTDILSIGLHNEEDGDLYEKYSRPIGDFRHLVVGGGDGTKLVYSGNHREYFTKSNSANLTQWYTKNNTSQITGYVDFDRAAADADTGVYLHIARSILSDIQACEQMSPEKLFKTFFILYNQVVGEPEEYEDNYPLEGIFESVIAQLCESSDGKVKAIQYAFEDFHMKGEIIEISRRINSDNADRQLDNIIAICQKFFDEKLAHDFEKISATIIQAARKFVDSFEDTAKIVEIGSLSEGDMHIELLKKFKFDSEFGSESQSQSQILESFAKKFLGVASAFITNGSAKLREHGLERVIALLLELYHIKSCGDNTPSNFESCGDNQLAKIRVLLEGLDTLLSSYKGTLEFKLAISDLHKWIPILNGAINSWNETLNAHMRELRFSSSDHFCSIDITDESHEFLDIASLETFLLDEYVEVYNASLDAIDAYRAVYEVLGCARNNCIGEILTFSGNFSLYDAPTEYSNLSAENFANRKFDGFFIRLLDAMFGQFSRHFGVRSVKDYLKDGQRHTAICAALDLLKEIDFNKSIIRLKEIQKASNALMLNVVSMTHSGSPTEASQESFFEFIKCHSMKKKIIKAEARVMPDSSVVSSTSGKEAFKGDATVVSYVNSPGSSTVATICNNIDENVLAVAESPKIDEIESSLNFLKILFTQIDELGFSLLSNNSIKAIRHTGGKLLGSITGLLNTLNSGKELEPKSIVTEMSILEILSKAIELFKKLSKLTATDEELKQIVLALKSFGQSVQNGLNR
jgi:hypothetical protein